MIALLQRASRAKVTVDDAITGEIGKGWLVLLGVGKADTDESARWLADRVLGLRAFADDAGKMNRSVLDISGELLVVSQFTLMADCLSGRRPSFTPAAPPAEANRLYEFFVALLKESGLKVATGIFAADMAVELVNDGPVTFWIDSAAKFTGK
ncbi:MAG: D-aminoacyl-tRNA deacylase [bacterium]